MARLLIVDDDENLLDSLDTLLRLLGHEPHVVSTHETVDERYADLRPHLLIHDVHMPGLDLERQIERLREAHGFVPLVLFSGRPDIETLVEDHDAVGHIAKPFDAETLDARLRALTTAADAARLRHDESR